MCDKAPPFLRPSFHYYLSSVHCCEDRFHIHVFNRSSNIWLPYIHNCLFITSRVYLKLTQWPAPWWLGRALHRYRRGHGSNPVQAWIFFRPSFHYYVSNVHYCEDSSIFTSLTAVQINDFHIFTTVYSSLHGFIWNQHSDQLPGGLLAQLVEQCTGITEVMVQIPYRPEFFFRLSFHYYLSSVPYCEDRLHIHVFKRSSNIRLPYIHNRLLISLQVYLEPTQWPAPS